MLKRKFAKFLTICGGKRGNLRKMGTQSAQPDNFIDQCTSKDATNNADTQTDQRMTGKPLS
jgi:hypothetical protein